MDVGVRVDANVQVDASVRARTDEPTDGFAWTSMTSATDTLYLPRTREWAGGMRDGSGLHYRRVCTVSAAVDINSRLAVEMTIAA